jgi:carbon monoxide dehydrogenase subunit G
VQLEHSFNVPLGIDEAWKLLLDLKRIGPCMPGAVIDSVEGDEFTGTVKVKLGPINLTYKGAANFVEKDDAAHRAVIDARGEDVRGNGTAAARVTATLVPAGAVTTVNVNTDLEMTGKPAQFGHGVMVDVGSKLLGQFADALADTISGDQAAANTTPAAKKSRPRPTRSTPPPHAGTETSSDVPSAAPAMAPAAESAAVEPPALESAPVEPAAIDSTALDETAPAAAAAPDPEPTPSYSVPGGVDPVSPNGFGADAGRLPAASAEPQGEVEPINLLEHARPAVAKRLAPVALAGVVLLIAARRQRKRSG